MAQRLANVKTRNQAGFDFVVSNLNILTPFGESVKKNLQGFFPGEEALLKEELDRVAFLKKSREDEKTLWDSVEMTFMEMKESSFTIKRAKKDVLTVVEIFELKQLILAMEFLRNALEGCRNKEDERIPAVFLLDSLEQLLKELDPRNEGLKTFYLYDEFSSLLASLREEKRQLEITIRKERKILVKKLKDEKGITLTPRFECIVSKSQQPRISEMECTPEICRMDEDYMSVTYELKDSEAIDKMVQKMDRIDEALDEEELKVRESLSRIIGDYEKPLLDNCERIGLLDFTYAKAVLAIRRNLVRPEIINEHLLEIEEGRHIEVESLLEKKGQSYRPVSLYLKQGVTCITGANMGGKTVSLKLAGLVALMSQYGFFVPAKRVRVGLSQHIQMLIGDTQSLERGLSSFGGEMEELREALDLSKPRTLLLIDELASGTNPKEGTALSKALVDYLMKKQYISLFTTHFDSVTEIPGVINLQVTGLANADFDKLKRELKYANRKERIQLVAKYMDYRLMVVEGQGDVPKEAIHIAEILGLYDEIISGAKEYL